MSEIHMPSYNIGHADGENCRDADYYIALTELTDWPEDLDVNPWIVAARLRELEEGS